MLVSTMLAKIALPAGWMDATGRAGIGIDAEELRKEEPST
jgi:hypothetical protein